RLEAGARVPRLRPLTDLARAAAQPRDLFPLRFDDRVQDGVRESCVSVHLRVYCLSVILRPAARRARRAVLGPDREPERRGVTMALTKRQKEILDFLELFLAE